MDREQKSSMDMTALRNRLATANAPEFWRGLGELAETEEFQQFLEDEFPNQARPLRMEMDRRQFMILSGASLALAGLAGCRVLPDSKIVPYVKAPEEQVPGQALYYATTMTHNGYGRGVLVESHEGRPTKIEGNPDHPASMGSTDVLMQAATLSLYDPDRSRYVMRENEPSTWEAFLTVARQAMAEQRKKGGTGLRILTETITSPTLNDQMKTLLSQFPGAKWHQYEPINHDNVRLGANLAFGQVVNTVYDFSKADKVLALDSDFLISTPGSVRFAHDFAERRRVIGAMKDMNRLYSVESLPTLTGAMADHRLPMRASDIEGFAKALAIRLGALAGAQEAPSGVSGKWFDALIEDLQSSKGRTIVIAGDHQTPTTHALVHAINAALGNVGSSVVYTDPVETNPIEQGNSLKELVADMASDKVEMLLMVGGNPIYFSPADLSFGQRLTRVPLRIHLSSFHDETSERCQWHVPETHFLEAWSDARAYDGTASIVQPLIAPLYDGKSAHEFIGALMDDARSGHDIVREYWKKTALSSGDFEKVWNRVLNDGTIPGTASPAKQVAVKPDLATALPYAPASNPQQLELIFAPDPSLWDGRYANNGWLMELPRPLTKLTWDNALLISPAYAERMHFTNEDMVEIEVAGNKLQLPVWINFGLPENTLALHLGYGRTRAGQIGTGKGFNAYVLRTTAEPWFLTNLAQPRAIGGKFGLATTENHHIVEKKQIDSQHDRDLIRVSGIEEYRKNPIGEHTTEHGKADFGKGSHAEGSKMSGGKKEEEISMYPGIVGGPDELMQSNQSFDPSEYNKWGMAIDLNTCIGCGVCTIACQAENNIPVVGKDQVHRGREMHWIRVDKYYKGGVDNPATFFQPLACVHCELAPCEPVCPVAATVHSHEGLNQMVYNRCIGTKYCSNNCPYKVRRFNFLNYANHWEQPVLMLAKNPDVTVRSRGVMEKCSYCTQRISRARIEAKKENRKIKGDEVITACQQACPTNAILFGDLNDKESKVSKAKEMPGDYALLEDLNTRPRTTYLTRLRNPNPKIGGEV